MADLTAPQFAAHFDSTNLRLDATDADLRQLCAEAIEHGFASVMVYPTAIPLCREALEGSVVKIGTVIGFPSGRFSVNAKAAEIEVAKKAGVHEVDIVMNYPALREGHAQFVEAELRTLCDMARERGLLTKVIVETCYLSEEQKHTALRLCEAARADYIKTSTGFGAAGAQVEDIRRWAQARETEIKNKAAGGMKNAADALAMIEAGAERLGASKARPFLEEFIGGEAGAPTAGDY